MSALDELIEARELEVRCPHCKWAELRVLSWLSGRRDMNCPTCLRVIVLNTSERRREIASLRRQVFALHALLADTISTADQFIRRTDAHLRSRPAEATLDLALPIAYRRSSSYFGNDPYRSRRVRR